MRTRSSLAAVAGLAMIVAGVSACQPTARSSSPAPSTVVSTVTQTASPSASKPATSASVTPSAAKPSASVPTSTGPSVAPHTYGPVADHPTVYMVELGKGTYGCGDKLVPGLKVADTRTPIHDAMTLLLKEKAGALGESGLTNALAQSKLEYADGKYDAATGLVQVWLTGQIVQSGTCDTPRIIGQLEMTALAAAQGSKAVQIYVNNKPLKDALSMR